MSRRDRKADARPLKRKVAIRQPRKTLVVFCEGERTEPEYLEALKRHVEWPRNHPGLPEAVQQARANGIQLAISNPCFELWLILHFQDHTSWLENNQARRLRRQLDGSDDKGLDAAKYMPFADDAAHRAARLDTRHVRDGTVFPHNNPSSGMHHLLAAVEPPKHHA